ncbi:MAG: formate dehydrogenase accessory sulfurtransferase FdhD [Spirochaetota bacterium]
MSRPPLPLAYEAPVLIRVDGKDLCVLFCTPLNLDELAVGHLVGRGLLPDRDALASLFICPDGGRVEIGRHGGPDLPLGPVALIASACGAGATPGELFGLDGRPLPAGQSSFSLAALAERSRGMFAAADLYRDTGGMHCAALAPPDRKRMETVREDVGRHNAVDKVVGRGFLDGEDLPSMAILTSGRIAVDMVVKAIRAGVPVLASRSIPTSSAYALARDYGMTLIGRIGSREAIVYCGDSRLLPE